MSDADSPEPSPSSPESPDLKKGKKRVAPVKAAPSSKKGKAGEGPGAGAGTGAGVGVGTGEGAGVGAGVGAGAGAGAGAGVGAGPSAGAAAARASNLGKGGASGPTATSVPTAVAIVRAYLQEQNRPFNATMIFDNLHGRVNKALLEGALSALVETGDIMRKEYGKAALFWPNQSKLVTLSPADISALTARRTELEAALCKWQTERRATEARINALASGLSGAALEAALTMERAKVAVVEERLAGIARAREAQAGGAGASMGAPKVLSTQEKASLTKSLDRYKKVWAARRDAVLDVAAGIADAGGPSIKELLSMAGVETDEDVKVSFKDV